MPAPTRPLALTLQCSLAVCLRKSSKWQLLVRPLTIGLLAWPARDALQLFATQALERGHHNPWVRVVAPRVL